MKAGNMKMKFDLNAYFLAHIALLQTRNRNRSDKEPYIVNH